MPTRFAQKRRLPSRWLVLCVILPLLAVLVVVRAVDTQDLWRHSLGVLFFLALYTAAEVLYVPLPKGGGVSVGLAVILACSAVYGPGITALVAGLGMTLAMLIASRDAGLARLVLNFGQVSVAAFLAGLAFRLGGGDLFGNSPFRNGVAFVLASATFFVANVTLVVASLTSITHQPVKAFWPDIKYNLASYFALVPLGLLVALIFISYGVLGALLFLVPLLFARYSFLQYLHTRNASLTVTQALAAALEAKDSYTRGHSDRVAAYAVKVARELNLSEEATETLRYAAEMHDIGKIGISENLLNKPGSLTDSELAEVRKHALIGADMVQKIQFLKGVSDVIRYHHEWYDGSSGYPRERSGEEIPLGARILMVCDSFDAMTSDRPYRDGLDQQEAVRRLKDGAGKQFDPQVVSAFLRVSAQETDARAVEG